MVTSRKRKRCGGGSDSTHDFAGPGDPPPFAPAELSQFKARCRPYSSRSVTGGLSPLILNLVLIAGHRLKVRDFASAALVLPTVLKRFRKTRSHRWFFSREVSVTGAHILRRSTIPNIEILDAFLSNIAADGNLASHPGVEGYAVHTRESVLLQRAMDFLSAGKTTAAYDALYSHSQEHTFRDCPLIQGYLGVVALALSITEPDPNALLRVSARALHAASVLEPTAYFYCYYAAATAIAAGKFEDAVALLRTFVNAKKPDDPIALNGLLACLNNQPHGDAPQSRQERVQLARRIVVADPLSSPAADILREAHAWKWQVEPPVDTLELARLFASRIEYGGMSDLFSWTELANCLSDNPDLKTPFWRNDPRSDWWPSHFFRSARLNFDLATNPHLAAAKAKVAKLLMPPGTCPYADAVAASGVVPLPTVARQPL